ncbi:hypothetical protein [Nocardia sp. XZ_19_385]|uniref:hypothetical protein n=1 Tax=Nocardia sp. XZ_19_385 TaxID=2769488 RepID=UPI00188F369F|nr:hypothetical protein [Nocardia sp. XZ_19_385]
MITEEVQNAEAAFVRHRVGVGGSSIAAVDATSAQRSGSAAQSALEAWESSPVRFPYGAVIAHFHAVGRIRAEPNLIARLDAIPVRRQDVHLAAWLPMTCDQVDGGYATYAGLGVHQTAVGIGIASPAGRGLNSVRAGTDEVTVAVLAELVRTEAEAAIVGGANPAAHARLRSAARLLARANDLAPGYPIDPTAATDLTSALAAAEEPLVLLAEAAERAVKAIGEQVSPVVAQAVRRSVLPVTRLHDEFMFIRCIQIFEALYEQIALAVREARDAVVAGKIGYGADVIAAASERLTVLPALFRVLGTMPPSVFAVIRGYTSGRSAVQSRSYRQIESACAPRQLLAGKDVPDVPWNGPTLQDVYLSNRTCPDADRLASELRRLDESWRRMKRSHWGITLRIIGEVPGTGGTSGAAYLQAAAATPLFPALEIRELQ